MRTIEIDFDIHKVIENERRGFSDTPNDALRRLLKLPEKAMVSADTAIAPVGPGNAWTSEGAVLEDGTKLRMVYGRPKRTYSGVVRDGTWIVEGKAFDSPSAAASGVAVTSKGKKTRLNGWGLWEVQRPGEREWVALDRLRLKHATTLTDLGLV